MGNTPSKAPMMGAPQGYGAVCPGSPGFFDERDAFEDFIAEPLVASDRKPSFKTRKSWDSVSSRDSKRMSVSLDSAFTATKDAFDKMMPNKNRSYNKLGSQPDSMTGIEW